MYPPQKTKALAKTKIIKLVPGAGYIRESTEDQDSGFSPDNQKRQIKEFAERNNIEIVEWYKDLISGKDASKRSDFQRMINDAQQGKFKAIVVYHTSRFARNRIDAGNYKNLLRNELGIDLQFVMQHFGDWKTSSGKLNEGINELFDEYYSWQLGEWVSKSLREKRAQGYQNGNPPLGYHKKRIGYDKKKGRAIYNQDWETHPEEAKLVQRIFKLYATGKYSYLDVAEIINKDKHKTKYGNLFGYGSIKGIVCNPVYLGLVTSPRKKDLDDEKGNHLPIISRELFNKAFEARRKRTHSCGRPVAQHRFYLLQNLLYCHHCIKYLEGKENNPKARMTPRMYCHAHRWLDPNGTYREKLLYGCKFRQETRTCPQKEDTPCELIDKQVIELMGAMNLPDTIIAKTLKRLDTMFENATKSKGQFNKIKQLQTQKKKLNTIYMNSEDMSEEEYMSQAKKIDDEITICKKLGLNDRKDGTTKRKVMVEAEKRLRSFKEFWYSEVANQERRQWILTVVHRIWVKNRVVTGFEPHEDFKPLFTSLWLMSGQPPLAAP